MTWRLAGSLVALRTQINAAWPARSRVSDGTIASRTHSIQNPTSDHEPNSQGVVCAMDITHDPASGADMNLLAENLRASRDPRIKYVIWNRRIYSSTNTPWTWRTYSGSNPHTKHLHLSVAGAYDRLDRWDIQGDEMPQFTDKQAEILAAFADEIDAQQSNGSGFARALIELVRRLKAWAG